jgi:carboxyl-terminal processing protease
VLGTQTFGKGSVQTITPLENGGALTLTTALYYTKSGNSIQARGVKPDIAVEDEADAAEQGAATRSPIGDLREEDLPGAIGNPSEGNASEESNPLKKINKTPTVRPDVSAINPEKEDIQAWEKKDSQFRRALDLLKTFSVFKPPQGSDT